LAEFRDRFADLQSTGIGIAALSVDPPETSRAFIAELALPFPLLSDARREVVQAYGLYNRREKGGIAYPATFVLSQERIVRFRSLDRTITRVNLDGLFAFLHGGLDHAPPESPERGSVVPGLRDFFRAFRSAFRHGARSPRS
jgi:peroxiredoxin